MGQTRTVKVYRLIVQGELGSLNREKCLVPDLDRKGTETSGINSVASCRSTHPWLSSNPAIMEFMNALGEH